MENPSVFLKTIVGSQGLSNTHSIEEYTRRIIISRFADTLPAILKSVLDLPAHYREIEVSLKKAVFDDLEQYGLKLVDLLVEAITVPPEVQQMIDRAAGSRALDESELKRYKEAAMSDALRDAAKNPGSGAGGITAGLGIGAGLGMAKEMIGQQNPPSEAGSHPKLTIDQVRAKLKELKSLVDEGLITQEDFEEQKKKLLDSI